MKDTTVGVKSAHSPEISVRNSQTGNSCENMYNQVKLT